jgi:hypothetical protein
VIYVLGGDLPGVVGGVVVVGVVRVVGAAS